MRLYLVHRISVVTIMLLGVLLLALCVVWVLQTDYVVEPSQLTTADLEDQAKELVAFCSVQSHSAKCYDEEIPKVMDDGFSMEEAFTITRMVQDLDDSYQYCHVLGHELSARETAKDPSKWKDVVARSPLGLCSNGGIHGAFQERFRVESFGEGDAYKQIVPELEGVCEPRPGWSPTKIGQASCVHALGHLTMYITDAVIENALDLCDRLDNDRGWLQLCYDGAFMQIYQPLEPEDFALIEGKEIETREEATEFCNQFTGLQRSSCVSESWPLYFEFFSDPATIVEICDPLKDAGYQHKRCIDAVFFVAMSQANLSTDWAENFCSQLPDVYRGVCYGNSAARLIEVDDRNVKRALDLCAEAIDRTSQAYCFDELFKYSDYTFIAGSPEFYELCEGMPSAWRDRCLAQAPDR